MGKKIKVGIFFGGISPEHEVSISSAQGIISNIDRSKFAVMEIFINKNGDFLMGKNVIESVKSGKIKLLKKLDISNIAKNIDVAFPVLHGMGGEDGSIQGFFKTLKIPFVGADILASAVCLDKAVFKELMTAHGIIQTRFVVLDWKRENQKEIKKKIEFIKKEFKFPLFSKPARTGSSVGISKIKKAGELEKCIKDSKRFDDKIIIEEAVMNAQEIEVSVLGNSNENIQASVPGKIIPGADFYDYADKYQNNATKFELPARLPKEKIQEIQALAVEVYKIANCDGLSRVDFFLDKNLKVYINEINTLPGFTPVSMYPKMWETSGLKYKDLITRLINLALEK